MSNVHPNPGEVAEDELDDLVRFLSYHFQPISNCQTLARESEREAR